MHGSIAAAIRSLKDGDVLKINPGTYPAGHSINGIANLTVEGADPENRPIIEGGKAEDIGPNGNFDGIKCSGLKDLVIRNCEISGWGGQAIDFVGCSDALITGCIITGKPGFFQHTGSQFKGGSENVTVEKCRFINAGERPVQAGGSTGKAFFRPPGANYEARSIFIRYNVFEGGVCAVAFTGVTDS